jgi:hypothetical protein
MDPITALALLTQLLTQANALGNLIRTAQAEGRDITPAELDTLAMADTNARSVLEAAITRARSEGR